MREVEREPTYLLGGHFHRWCLSVNVADLVNDARALMQATMLHQLREPLPPRVEDSMLVVVIGNLLQERWCEHLGVTVASKPKLKDSFMRIVGNVTDSNDGGGVKDGFDRFLEACSAYAQVGELKKDTHYSFDNAKKQILYLHLESCHLAYQKERRTAGLSDETNGLPALRRIIREKLQLGSSYIVGHGERQRFGSSSRQIRCVTIDTSRIPEHIAFEMFPGGANVAQAPLRGSGEWN
jgi:hypothetical protein